MSHENDSGDRSPRSKVWLTPPPRLSTGPSPLLPIREHGRPRRWAALAGALTLAGGAVLVGWSRVATVPVRLAAESGTSPVSSPLAPGPNVGPDPADSPHATTRLSRQESVAPALAVAASPSPDAFLEAMSEGHRALDVGDWGAARAAFNRAGALQPGSARDGMARAEEGERLASVEAHRRRGAELEAAEDWRAAAAEYEAALKLDAVLAFALDGYARAAERARLQERLDRHLAAPRRLSADAVGQEAERVLQRVRELQPLPPGLERRAALLDRRLAEARTGVRVELRSDGLTEVTVLRVGGLGGFAHRVLELRPGPYTIVGTRKGYRDVRRQVVIEAGRDPGPIDVRCLETL